VLLLVIAWTLALASLYIETLAPLPLAVAVLLVLTRPSVLSRETRMLDAALVACLVVIALQLVPLNASLRARIAPAAIAYERLALVAGTPTAVARGGPVSVRPAATALALAVVTGAVLLFWSARTLLQRGGLRTTIRGIAVMATIAVPVALVQHLVKPHAFYGLWPAGNGNALPFTPFVNRNDFAAWLIMALPLAVGYAAARIESRVRGGERFDVEMLFDGRGMLLTFAVCLMTAGALASLSRSALAGAGAGMLLFFALARTRVDRRTALGLLAAGAATLALAVWFAAPGALAERLGGSMSEGIGGRLSIWRQTWPMVRDFWPAGSGVGTYQPVMLLYQTSSRLFYISHADNEYLQIVAEGGAPLAIAAAAVLLAAAVVVARRLRSDRSPVFWIRAGAASGLLAFAVQNFFEMTMRVPANAVLLVTAAAIAMHQGRSRHAGV
jgi:O-antigen ligase